MEGKEAPIGAMLRAARGTVRFHMPGHKGTLLPEDMTELARTDDLYAPAAAILEAERLAARSCGAGATLLLTGGSTAGLLAMLPAFAPPGSKLLLTRNAHNAAVSACVLWGVEGVFADDLTEAMALHPDAKAVLVTRPDYYGRCGDLAPLAKRAREAGMALLSDEAHGAHFSWWDAPESAGRLGARAWVQSAHKTLPALTGGAWLHLRDAEDADRCRRFLRMVQTSSPPFPILTSLDEARAWMDAHGVKSLAGLVAALRDVRARLEALGGYACPPADDPTRLVIETRGRGLTGFEAQAALEARGVDVEMADEARLVLICTVADRRESFDALAEALGGLPRKDPLPPASACLPPPGERVCSLRQAALSPQEAVPLSEAAGRVASVAAGMYPPGTPFALPGERVTEACAKALLALAPKRRFGVEKERLICMKRGVPNAV